MRSRNPPSPVDQRTVFDQVITEICQGTNSFCPYPCCSLLDFSPEAQASIIRKNRSPTLCTVAVPSTISPQLISMSSCWRSHSAVLVASLSDGDGWQP